MKKHILLTLLLAPCFLSQLRAQNYVVTSLATPGAATFASDKITDGCIHFSFGAATDTLHIQTNQQPTVSTDTDWCQASFADGILTISVTENTTEDARTAIITVRSKDFHPLLLTVKQESRLVFAVISDTHVGNTWGEGYTVKIPQALKNLTRRGKLDAMAVVGDLTDNGRTGQYQEFVQFFGSEENILNPIDNFLFMMGNHDNYDQNGQSNYRSGLRSFYGNRNYPLDQYVLIKGYPFITISQRSSANNDDNISNGTNSYPNTVVSTLKRYLKQAVKDAPGKPIFVFTHVAPRWTCYSSWGEIEGAAWAMKVLNPVLNEYPQVVAFCGHSHYPLGDPRSIHQGANPNSERNNYYTVINTASTTYSEINPGAVNAGIHPEGYTYVTEGMILAEQPNGDIEIQRYDTYRDVEIDPDHRWVLKAPFDGSMFQYADIRDSDDNPNNVPLRNGLPAPTFAEGSQPTVDPFPGEAKVTFPQATDNECVFRYKIRILKNGTEVQSVFVFSQFYLTTDMPSHISYNFDGLDENTEYTAEVVAYDSWDNTSEPISVTFTVPADDAPLPEPKGWWTFDNPEDPLACIGTATMQAATHTPGAVTPKESIAQANISMVSGPEEGNRAISVPANSSLLLTTNLDVESLSTYSFLMDIHMPSISGYTSLFQNDLTNTKDASLFVYNGTIGKGAGGLNYGGMITSAGWHRILFVVRDNKARVYIDGTLIGQSTSTSPENWMLSSGLLFYADQDGEEHVVETSEIRFWDTALTNGQVAKLGTAISGEATEVTIPDALGVWTFDDPDDLLAGTGTAVLLNATHSTDGSGSVNTWADSPSPDMATAGPAEGNGAMLVPFGSSLLMDARLDSDEIGTYTVMWDVKGEDLSSYVPLLQNDLTNKKDGSLFFNKNKVGLAGSLGYYGTINNNQWYRIVFVVEAPNKATLYVDGSPISFCEREDSYNMHWKLTTGALFFADNDGEEKAIETAEIRFWNVALDMAQVAKLGAAGSNFEPTPDPVIPDEVPEEYCTWTFDDMEDALIQTGGTGSATLQGFTYNLGAESWQATSLLDAGILTTRSSELGLSDGFLQVPVGGGLLMTSDITENLSTYSILMDIKLDDVSDYAALFQNNLGNDNDASLFVKNGQIGLNDAGMGYNGTVQAGAWHRVVAVVKNNYCTVYIDGQKVVQGITDSQLHWELQAGNVLFFIDQDGEEKPINVSELRFWNVELADKHVLKLGKAGGAEAQPAALPEATGTWTFDNIYDFFAGTGTATLKGWGKDPDTILVFRSCDGYKDGDNALFVPKDFGLVLKRDNDSALESYTWSMDIKLDDVSGYASLFQNDVNNEKDGSLFVKDGKVGVAGTAGTGYNGTVQAGHWHRVTFVVSKLFGYVYIDGVKVGRSIRANETHWKLGESFLFFTDNDGEAKDISVSEIRFWEQPLTQGEIELLGGIPLE